MPRVLSVDEIADLYAVRGADHYGEGVTQMEHALQCAALAQDDGASDSLIAAALLHDIGHLFEDERDVVGAKFDGRHEIAGAWALKGLFGDAVRRPIALHVAAKRWLCFAEPGYVAALSPASQQSLVLQGGPFGAAQAAAFERLRGWRDAVTLRRYDDIGKRDDPSRRTFEDFAPLLHTARNH